MQIAWSQLNHLPVVTESGHKLGVVEGVNVDTDSHSVWHYEIKPGGVFLGLLRKPFLIAPAEVVAITADQMTVKDTVTPVEATNSVKTRLALSATPQAGVEMSERE